MSDRAHHEIGEAPRQPRLPHHHPEADRAEQKPRRGIGEPRKRRLEFRHAKHPEQKAADDAGDAVIENLDHPRRDHEHADGERVLRLRIDADRQEPEGGGAGGQQPEDGDRSPLCRNRLRHRGTGTRAGAAASKGLIIERPGAVGAGGWSHLRSSCDVHRRRDGSPPWRAEPRVPFQTFAW